MDKVKINEILIEEFRALRKEIDSRIKILHFLISLGSIFWVIFIIAGILLCQNYSIQIFYSFLLLIPLIFVGLTFNYQDNQRTLETTARYLEINLKPKLKVAFGDEVFGWEQWFASQKRRYRLSSSFKLFSLLVPLILPIILLIYTSLNNFQTILATVDLLLLIVVIANFRYKLFRIK